MNKTLHLSLLVMLGVSNAVFAADSGEAKKQLALDFMRGNQSAGSAHFFSIRCWNFWRKCFNLKRVE